MGPKQRVVLLVTIMAVIVLAVEATTITILYNTAIQQTLTRLQETAQSQARLIEAITRFNRGHHEENIIKHITLQQLRDAHKHYAGFGKTGEFTLAEKQDNTIVFLLAHRHFDLENPRPVPFNSHLAAPMHQALSGLSGTIIGPDYRDETVVAAYEPVQELNLGIVAKIDIAEVRRPFILASIISGSIAILLIIGGSILFIKLTNPLIKRLSETINKLQAALANVKTLRGLLPICASCKKIRDDKGYWKQIEGYIAEHSEADFSHGICPECAKELFPEFADDIDEINEKIPHSSSKSH